VTSESKILLLVMGGLPHPETGRAELESARTPNLDALARESACGELCAELQESYSTRRTPGLALSPTHPPEVISTLPLPDLS
jgi:hypothetical protein